MKRITALFLALLLLALLGACGGEGKDVRLAQAQLVNAPATSLITSLLSREEQTRVSRSDMTVLYYDEASGSISVYDAGAKQLWRALPETADGADHAMLRVKVLVKNEIYTLSSQSDCVAQGGLDAQIEDGVLHLTYDFVREIGRSRVHLSVPVTFTTEDGTMRVEVDCAALKAHDCSRDVTVLSLEVLPSFGAVPGEDGDFLFVPDGCGAVMRADDPTPMTCSLPVYGDFHNIACVAAFGMKRGDGAFVALAQQGDALATVSANRPGGSACSTVGVSFAVTVAKQDEDGETLHLLGAQYAGKLSLAYRFLSSESADIAGMAAACRELLVRDGTLDYLSKRADRTALSLHVTLISSASFAVPGQGSFVSRHTVTTLAQAQDILSLLRSKGVTEMDVVLRGSLRGNGKNGSLRYFAAAESDLSGKAFLSFAAAQNAAVYPEVSALSAQTQGRSFGGERTATLQTFAGSRVTAETTVTLRGGCGRLNRLLRQARTIPADGLALTDAGAFLAPDGAGRGDRQALKETLCDQLSMLYAAKPLVISGGNLYALKYASAVTELPNEPFFSGSGYDAAPFLQILLHGYCDYSGTPLNLAEDVQTAILKAAQYGETPAILCYYNDYGNAETPDNCNYLQAASAAQQGYERLSSVFADLGDKRITAHEEVKPGVFATTYGNTATVYVNYNDQDVTVHGVTVEGRSILRIK